MQGFSRLNARLTKKARIRSELQQVVSNNTKELQRLAAKEAPVDTGNLRNSIEFSINGLTGRIVSRADYSAYVEFGTRKMRAQPFMRPAYRQVKEKFFNDLKGVVNK